MNISGLDEFTFKSKNNTIAKATKNSNGNWSVSWVDYDGALQRVTYLASEFEGILKSWSAVEVPNEQDSRG